MFVPLDTEHCFREEQKVRNRDEIDESISDVAPCDVPPAIGITSISHRTRTRLDKSSNAPFWKSILKYKKSILLGLTESIYPIKCRSVILFGIFLIITVVRVSIPASMAGMSRALFLDDFAEPMGRAGWVREVGGWRWVMVGG